VSKPSGHFICQQQSEAAVRGGSPGSCAALLRRAKQRNGRARTPGRGGRNCQRRVPRDRQARAGPSHHARSAVLKGVPGGADTLPSRLVLQPVGQSFQIESPMRHEGDILTPRVVRMSTRGSSPTPRTRMRSCESPRKIGPPASCLASVRRLAFDGMAFANTRYQRYETSGGGVYGACVHPVAARCSRERPGRPLVDRLLSLADRAPSRSRRRTARENVHAKGERHAPCR
jgi:hypothetical protein